MPRSQSLLAEYRERVARAVEYIEARLGEPQALERAAEAACWSPFHFHRIFSAATGLPPGEYLRMRRLTEGAKALASGRSPVSLIAAEVGFGSTEAFHRSFKAAFGLTPAAYRRSATSMATLNPFAPNVRPLAHRAPCLAGEPSVERFGPLRLACAEAELSLDGATLVSSIRALWDEAGPSLAQAAGRPDRSLPDRTFGLAEPSASAPGDRILYRAGVEPRPDWAPRATPAAPTAVRSGLTEFLVPAGEYLKAVHRGPVSRLNETYLYLYGYWMPRAGLEPGALFDFDEYGDGYDPDFPESPESAVVFRIPLRLA